MKEPKEAKEPKEEKKDKDKEKKHKKSSATRPCPHHSGAAIKLLHDAVQHSRHGAEGHKKKKVKKDKGEEYQDNCKNQRCPWSVMM